MTIYEKTKAVGSVNSVTAKVIIGLVIAKFPDTNKTSILPSDLSIGSKYLAKGNTPLFRKIEGKYSSIKG